MHRSILLFLLTAFVVPAFGQQPGVVKGPALNPSFKVSSTKTYPGLENAVGVAYQVRFFDGAPFRKAPAGTVYVDPEESIRSYSGSLKSAAQVARLYPGEAILHPTLSDTMGWVWENEYIRYPIAPDGPVPHLDSVEWVNTELYRSMDGVSHPYYVKQAYVTNAEYREFIRWTRDSICLRILGETVSEEFLGLQFPTDDQPDPPYLVWDKIQWDDVDQREALQDIFLREHERYERRKRFDTRKFFFQYYQLAPGDKVQRYERYSPHFPESTSYSLKKMVNVYPDTLRWLSSDRFIPAPWEEAFMNTYSWHPYFDQWPVVGISPVQAEAFLAWKTKQHRLYLRQQENGTDYQVYYDLPTRFEAEATPPAQEEWLLPQPGEGALDFWRITVGDYREFVYFVQDSVAHRALGAEVDESHLIHEDLYGGSREGFPLVNWKAPLNWDKLDEKDLAALVKAGILKEVAIKEAGKGKSSLRKWVKREAALYEYMRKDWRPALVEGGLDLDLSYTDYVGRNTGQRGSIDVSEFFHKQILEIYPKAGHWRNKYGTSFFDDKSHDDESMPGISYEQALAYYHWRLYKSKLRSAKPKAKENPTPDQMLPTALEWQEAMAGIIPTAFDGLGDIPGPLFRYVILVDHRPNPLLRLPDGKQNDY